MRAIEIQPDAEGRPALVIGTAPVPEPAADEVLIDVVAAGVNRADLLQAAGHYPPPVGASPILGLEVSGVVAAVGESVQRWQPGDEVCALLTGGGYAEHVAVPAGQVLPVPSGVQLVEAAGLAEVACTVWSNLGTGACLQAGESVLLHGGGSGIGTFAIQWARQRGARVLVTAGSERKLRACADLGADGLINYRNEDFVERVRELTSGRGVDVVLDVMGAKYLERNIAALADGGRLVIIGLQGGVKAEINLGVLLSKRGTVMATALRSRPAGQKAHICAEVEEQVWPLIAAGAIRPVIDRVLPWERAGEAHAVVAASEHVGKVLLRMR